MEKVFKNWITNNSKHPFYARKEIYLDDVPDSAEISVCGLGQFNFYVNGSKVGDRILDPAWTDYDKLINYVTFDISKYLVIGRNVLAAEIGNGWFIMDAEGGYSFYFPPFMPPNPNPYRPFSEYLVFAAHLEVQYADKRRVLFDADESWKVAPHPVLISNCFGSEAVDGRKKIAGWNDLSSDDSEWEYASVVPENKAPCGLLEEQIIPPIKVIKTYEGKYLHTVGGRSVYDFGQNVSGMLSFKVKGKANDVVHAYPAEKLDANGDVDQMAKNWIMIDVTETYTIACDDVFEEFDMTFAYFGGRYVAFDVSDSSLKDVKLKAISSAYSKSGEFFCDDERFMQIYDLVDKAVEANMVGVHTDCPTIERFAWQEENHLMAPSVMYMDDVRFHWEKFLKDTRTAQHTAEDSFNDMAGGKVYPGEGLIPSQAPCYIPNVLPVPGMGDFYDIIGWGSTIILGTYWHYLFYGDKKIVEDNYEAGKKYLAYLKTRVNEEGFINHGLGDWGNPAGEFARENVETAFLFADAKLLGEFAAILGNEADAAEFFSYAEAVKKNYNEKLLVYDNAKGRFCYKVFAHPEEIVMTQAAEAMPLFWGMVPKEKEADIVSCLKDAMLQAGSFSTGEVGQPYIIQMLKKYGMNDLISELILKEEHPSYYAFVKAGETTLGEYWEENPRSHCHDMMGHIVEWYYNGIAGINPLLPGFKKVLIKPYLPESIGEVNCTYKSASGPISVHLKRNACGITLDVNAAVGIEIEIDESNLK